MPLELNFGFSSERNQQTERNRQRIAIVHHFARNRLAGQTRSTRHPLHHRLYSMGFPAYTTVSAQARQAWGPLWDTALEQPKQTFIWDYRRWGRKTMSQVQVAAREFFGIKAVEAKKLLICKLHESTGDRLQHLICTRQGSNLQPYDPQS